MIAEAKDVEVSYRKKVALEDVTFEVPEPSIVAVMGPNGAGKSTLLRAMLGLLPYRGHLRVLGCDPRNDEHLRRRIGYMPQREHLSAHIPVRVRDVVMMSLTATRPPLSPPGRDDVARAKKALEAVGLSELWNEPFSHLSGGQRQRVLLARALAGDPEMLLLDEPFNGMDMPSQEEVVRVLVRKKKEGVASFVVVHDLTILAPCVDYVILLNGKMVAFGTPPEVLTVETLRRVYGADVPVVEHCGICYALVGDRHA